MVLLDNAKYHKTQPCLKTLKKAFDVVIFLPPYSAQYQAWEFLFQVIKKKARSDLIREVINWSGPKGREYLERKIKEINPETIIGFFKEIYSQIYRDIIN